MRLLVLGGSDFVGRVVAEDAVRRGWQVTLLNRGTRTPPDGVAVRRGDREAPDGLAALAEDEWDVVVDTWSGAPHVVRDAARLLSDRAGHYAYVSSRSVYTFPAPAGADENAPLVESSADAGATDYARDKRGAEIAVTSAFGERSLLVRAGLILGRHENAGRLPWWLRRLARGGPVPAPGPYELPLQYVDVRDLAAWTLDSAARGLSGAYDTVSAPGHTTMGELLEYCAAATGSAAELRWVTPEEVAAAGVQPWTGLPVWMPPGELHDALHGADTAAARAAGLRCRPVVETVADTWEWLSRNPDWRAKNPPGSPGVGLDADSEALLLAGSS
ncbi:reductase [Streptomyces sp. 549]|uniref:NAD-dependent epimerase/dehydratase family protein n=1 Tax=Streptomyces sp. 549 TaxID=3049076 RepID=UPI0024C26084|nr:NAD-dependent epimerase/dehydratase family protein [Streptomyces sp. 549]MDK1475216.1 reductase [Streptomyces sp. 549]